MAGDWFKLEHATVDKPEIFQIAEALNIDPETVLTKIVRVWIWFDQHSIDGTAPVTLSALLNRAAGVTGFTKAMEDVGWLEKIKIKGKDCLFLPNFERHVGESAKKRALTARRVAKSKRKNAKSNDENVTKVTPPTLLNALPSALPNALPRVRVRERPYIKQGGYTDSSEGKTENNPRPTNFSKRKTENKKQPAAKPKDFSAFIPFDKTRERIKLNCPNITDAFIEGSLAEFITYAEAHYRPVQLQSKFIKSVTSDFKYRELNGQRRKAEQKFRVPKDVNKVEAWAKKHDYPAPRPGEETGTYMRRIEQHIDQHREQI